MLKLLLDHDYRQAIPAVDVSPFANHGLVTDAIHLPNGSQPGSGALRFEKASSSVRVALRPCWQRIEGLLVEAWINVRATGTRRNVVEGDGSFAFFVAADDTLTGSVFALIDGASSPGWHTVSSGTNSLDGVIRTVPTNQWCKVLFHYDGITQARVFIDDKLAGARADYRSGLAAVASTGVVIGNWTLTNQYAFNGDIDRIRVWKRDEDEILRNFGRRPIEPAARDHWDEIWSCLGRNLNVDQVRRLKLLGQQWDELIRQLFRAVQKASPSDRDAYLALLEIYRKHWLENKIGELAFVDAIVALRDLILHLLGPKWLNDATTLAYTVQELLGSDCFNRERFSYVDPEFATFIANAVTQMQPGKGEEPCN